MPAAEQHLTIASRTALIEQARRWVGELARDAGYDDAGIADVEVAMTEALSNVIRHAYDGDPTREIELAVAIDDERIELRLRDWGLAFDPNGYVPPDLTNPGVGGLGVFMIEALMDEVQWGPAPGGGNLMTMTKRRG